MIVRITFLDEQKQPYVMLFGDSYKTWDDQCQEYFYDKIKWYDKTTLTKRELFGIQKVEVSRSKWVMAGLKCCGEETFQEELNREWCQDNEPDNLKPRQYAKMNFEYNRKVEETICDMYHRRLRHLQD
ncbi:MAG: hypothetical protein WC623_23975 [Pedobacter sp.]|uniref:hypothetical protein n=1 Tax=Pedobacter sp. TaxID=1411316 RepID=UPI003566A09A